MVKTKAKIVNTPHACADGVTMDPDESLESKCIINLLCLRMRPDILATSAMTTPP